MQYFEGAGRAGAGSRPPPESRGLYGYGGGGGRGGRPAGLRPPRRGCRGGKQSRARAWGPEGKEGGEESRKACICQ